MWVWTFCQPEVLSNDFIYCTYCLSDMSLDSNLKQNVALDDPRCPFTTYNSFINGAENLKQLR